MSPLGESSHDGSDIDSFGSFADPNSDHYRTNIPSSLFRRGAPTCSYGNNSSPSSRDNNNASRIRNLSEGLKKLDAVAAAAATEQSPSSSPTKSSGVGAHDLESLEGLLCFRKGRSAGSTSWQRRYVVLNLLDGGSLTCFKDKPPPRVSAAASAEQKQPPAETSRNMYTKVHRHVSSLALSRHMSFNLAGRKTPPPSTESPPTQESFPASQRGSGSSTSPRRNRDLKQDVLLHIPTYVNWMVKDIFNDACSFVVEIATSDDQADDDDSDGFAPFSNDEMSEVDSAILGGGGGGSSVTSRPQDTLRHDWTKAKRKGKPLRFYFKCSKSGNEKTLWLSAFSTLDRLSTQARKKKSLLNLFSSPYTSWTQSRIRSPSSVQLAKERRQLDSLELSLSQHSNFRGSRKHKDSPIGNGAHYSIRTAALAVAASSSDDGSKFVEHRIRSKTRGDKEYRVVPYYAYPHRWMTPAEMREEMLLPSIKFHDLRVPSQEKNEIGSLQVEVLQCVGLPKLDRTSETDAVVYLVCGSYAFATDVIPDRANPMWLRKSRRACIFPLFHAHARLFVGVFDDDGKRDKDDIAGRVVVDVARLRPMSTYDVTLPLRLSSHVYTRRKRGAIRLRFTLTWKSERAALLSYLPKQLKFPVREYRRNDDVTVLCGDAKAFRNVALTVHGVHLPGRFSFQQLRATLREINYSRKMVMTTFREGLRDTRQWKNPALSGFLFMSWMHCIYINSFALVPAYFMSFCLLLLLRNYARYVVNGAANLGFLPATIEEMWMALFDTFHEPGDLFGRIEPLELGRFGKRNSLVTPSLDGSDHSYAFMDSRAKTHEPQGKALFRLLGFLEDDDLDGMAADDEHMEFPFANGIDYPKFTVPECIRPDTKRKNLAERGSNDAGSYLASHDVDSPFLPRFDIVDIPEILRKDSNGQSDFDEEEDEFERNRLLGGPAEWFDMGREQGGGGGGKAGDSNHLHNYHVDEFIPESGSTRAVQQADKSESPLVMFPDQNVDITGPKKGKLTDDLAEIKEKVSEFWFHMFADRAYVVRHPNACFFGHARRSEKRRKADVSKDLDKVLNTGQYSQSNPVMSRVGLYIEPLVGCAQIFLCAFRSLFNALTWQDPFLTFWITTIVGVTAVILFVFPWRIFLFLAGLVVVGPQNWVLRILRERGIYPNRRPEKVLLESLSNHESSPETPNADATATSGSAGGVSVAADNDLSPPLNQPIFSCHAGVNEQPKELRHAHVNAREIHHVVVPYTPLMYSRFYDWPPEPQYAQVVPDTNGDALRRLHHHVNASLNRGSNHTRSSCSSSGGPNSGNVSSPMALWKQNQSSLRSLKSDRPKKLRSLFSRSSTADSSKQS